MTVSWEPGIASPANPVGGSPVLRATSESFPHRRLLGTMPMDGTDGGAANCIFEPAHAMTRADHPTDELAYPATDTRHRGHAGAGRPRRAAFHAESKQRHQRGAGQSGCDG